MTAWLAAGAAASTLTDCTASTEPPAPGPASLPCCRERRACPLADSALLPCSGTPARGWLGRSWKVPWTRTCTHVGVVGHSYELSQTQRSSKLPAPSTVAEIGVVPHRCARPQLRSIDQEPSGRQLKLLPHAPVREHPRHLVSAPIGHHQCA